MKLSVKMMLIFSGMMLVSLLILSSYAASVTVTGANAFTEARFRNMNASIENALQREHLNSLSGVDKNKRFFKDIKSGSRMFRQRRVRLRIHGYRQIFG